MAEGHVEGERVTAPSDWQGWQRWVEGVDWPDRRGWLQRVAPANWAQGQTASPAWAGPPRADAVSLTLLTVEEDQPGNRIREHLAATWPAFCRW